MLRLDDPSLRISKADYERMLPGLRVGLINAQFDLRESESSLLLLVAGDDRIACEQAIDRIHEWMDARFIRTEVFGPPTDEEAQRPRFWRYWRALPSAGLMGIHFGAWALGAVADRVYDRIDDDGLAHRIERIRAFEQCLVDNRTRLLKLWFHLPKDEHEKRLAKASKGRGSSSWRVTDRDWKILDTYDKTVPIATRFLEATHTRDAPWTVVDGTHRRTRDIEVARRILSSLALTAERDVERFSSPSPVEPPPEPVVSEDDAAKKSTGERAEAEAEAEAEPEKDTAKTEAPASSALGSIDLSRQLEYDEYRKQLAKQQRRLRKQVDRAVEGGMSSVFVFEGMDAAGKGGVIRRLTQALSARDYRVVPISAPTDEERAHPYLWRFWRRMPRAGRMLVYDRSWYGRVLVERVEGYATESEWRRAYGEINDFEEQIVENGIPVVKFWMHIDPDEQLRRFEAREATPYKKYKITDEDYRNRGRWADYARAVDEMVARTDTPLAPWHLVPANDKRYARVRILETIADALRDALKKHGKGD